MNSNIKIYYLLLFFLSINNLYSQDKYFSISTSDTFSVNLQNLYELDAIHVIPTSEKIFIGKKVLNRSEYNFDNTRNSFSLSDTLQYSLFDTVIVNYDVYSLKLKKTYKHRSLIRAFDIEMNDTIRVVKSEEIDLSSKSIFGKNLNSSGTLLRGFSLGTNKDMTVSSGLRLQLSGNISDDIEIVAALTDENTPIQPEGNTERLEELDKVFIEIKHKKASGVFGDYNYSTQIGEFGRVERKLQGVLGKVHFADQSGSFAFASSRGKFNSMQMNGIDGVQGPYRLVGADNENDIIVIAGSEKVYIDGKLLKRGEDNQYTIEYSNGELTFTPKVILTSLSRIVIDFEYTNRQYDRNVLGANAEGSFFDKKLKVRFNAFQEGDNKNSPIDISLSDEDKEILSNSGDNTLIASTTGIFEVATDSLGIYTKRDTVLNGEEFTYYFYNPGDADAKFNISFSYVGTNNGDYTRESIGNYKFVGIGEGSYLPIRVLPLPETNQVGNIVLDYSPTEEINLNFEVAASSYDRNTFSSLDDNDNNGFARTINLTIKPIDISINKIDLGKVGASFKDRYKDEQFKSIDRINEIEFDRNYNTTGTTNNEETLREFKLNYLPTNNFDIFGQYGFLKRGSNFESERILSKLKVDNYSNLNLNYEYDFVSTNLALQKSKWFRQSGNLSYDIWKFQPGFEFRTENKNEHLENTDSLLLSSLKYSEYSPFLLLSISKGFNISAKYSFTEEKAPDLGLFIDESKTYSQTYSFNYNELREFNSSIDVSFRKKKYSDDFTKKGFGDNESVQIRAQNNIKLWDRLIEGNIFYQTASERSSKLERIFIRVPQGTGSYSYIGDTNDNGIAEESEFIPDQYEGDFILTTVPTDELFPVIDLKLNTRFKLEFERHFKNSDFISTALNAISTETTYRIEENSRILQPERIYLLNFDYFLNDSLTIRGFNYFQQDLHILKNKQDLSFRLRFTERNSLNQFSSGTEKSYSKQRSVKLKFRMVKELNNEMEIINEIENVLAPISSNRSRQTVSNSISSNFSYRPYSNFELGFLFNVERLEDSYPEKPTIIDENKLSVRFTLSLLKKGRLRIEIERTELLANTKENIIPFEITNGNLIGKNYIWRANFDYRFSSNLQTNINYSGRLQGKGKVVNTFTAEARAYF